MVRDPVPGVPLAINLCRMEGAGHSQRRVLGGTRESRARGADDESHVLPAVPPIHLEEHRGTSSGDHAIGPVGNVCQLAAGTLLLGVVAQTRAAPER